MLNQIIPYSFYLLFFLTPLFWSSLNYELFEFNKMFLVYIFTVIITGTWLFKTINDKHLTIKRTPLDIPLLLFLGANILSTIFSIDQHISIWGYYSRLNGGLLSTISYLLLYWAFVSNMDFTKVKTALKYGLASGFLISLWAISEHFGVSPSCVILRGEFNADCWVQMVQERVFATLGQPNWLAAYLAMLIFPALYFFITAKGTGERITYYISLVVMYMAFTFTYSRGPTLGLIGGMITFLSLLFFERIREDTKKNIIVFKEISHFVRKIKPLLLIILSFLIINLLFGSALTSFRLISKFAAPVRPGINIPAAPIATGTQLENGGTESGQIRLIVWKGALDIFKNYPIFGSGLETFAYSYYQYRPVEHNLTSEWDFLYNKAHNEYLNYLATTGIIGFGAYMLIIGTFFWWSIKQFKNQNSRLNKQVYDSSNLKKLSETTTTTLNFELLTFNSALFAAYLSYLISNFFLFSVVIIAVFFFLFPTLAFIATDSTKKLVFPRKFLIFNFELLTLIYRRPVYTQAAKGIIIFFTLYFLYSIFQIWSADTLFAQGQRSSEAGNPGRAYNSLKEALELNKNEPFYKSEFSFSAAQAAASLHDTDATLSAALKDEAIVNIEEVLKNHPKNTSFWRTAVRTYFELSLIDKSYTDKTLQVLDTAIKLAPTDPKLHYNKALILGAAGRKDEQIRVLQEALKLKPNYVDAIEQLKEATASAK